MERSTLVLSLFFHLIATAIWIGGLFITVILVWPALRRTLEQQPAVYRLLSHLRQKFYAYSNLSLVTLVVTGLFQMTADPYYEGFMTFNNEWSRVMLAKHIAIVCMAVAGLVLQYGVAPALERLSMLLEKNKGDVTEWATLRQREVQLTWGIAILGLVVLGFSAWATAL